MPNKILTDAQLEAELKKCEYCEEKPCRTACPAHCSPADFVMAARLSGRSDFRRAAAEIMMANPLGGVCGLVCPEHHCQKACAHRELDGPVEIPSVQATLIARARELGVMPAVQPPARKKKARKVAVIGAGPAGLAAAALLARSGFAVTVHEAEQQPGGACLLIPEHRLPRPVLEADIAWLLEMSGIELKLGSKVAPAELLEQGFAAVVVAAGLSVPIVLGVPGEERAVVGLAYLKSPASVPMPGSVAVVGGGATAVDCAVTARRHGARRVELISLERWDEMPLTAAERAEVLQHGIEVCGRTRVCAMRSGSGGAIGLELEKVTLPEGAPFSPAAVQKVEQTRATRWDFQHVIVAIGARRAIPKVEDPRIFWAGDIHCGASSVVQAVASGKNAALEVEAALTGGRPPVLEKHGKSHVVLPGWERLPVPLHTDFFGRKIRSPLLLSAAPPSDGYAQMRKAYEAGWAGGVMKTAFDGVPIHIPGEYMHAFDEWTYGNCDNVSGHALERVCAEVQQLVAEFPDRLTMASTGGPVSGNDEADRRQWQSNTKKLEQAGVMGIEYSLSCPQGGDGTEGDIVSQSAALTAKIIDWVMQVGDAEVPKLFKLTAAVTSIGVILQAVRGVLQRYPEKRAGVTLANTFPTLFFRPGQKAEWEEGIVVGMSGAGVLPISYLTLASVASLGVTVSGNGGPMDYKAAADFLALGARTVQLCTIVMKHGYGIVDHLHGGLSHLLAERGIGSVAELCGRALPRPVTDFMALSPVKKISQVQPELCLHCGNCTRCPYLAVTLDEKQVPATDPARCIGCSICVQKCFSRALRMRERTPEEAAALQEA